MQLEIEIDIDVDLGREEFNRQVEEAIELTADHNDFEELLQHALTSCLGLGHMFALIPNFGKKHPDLVMTYSIYQQALIRCTSDESQAKALIVDMMDQSEKEHSCGEVMPLCPLCDSPFDGIFQSLLDEDRPL
jgi:hypothetical protein